MRNFFQGFKKGFGEFSMLVANAINFAMLFIVYLLGVGLTAIIAKIAGKHFLDLKFKKRETYWVEREIKKEKFEEYYRQF